MPLGTPSSSEYYINPQLRSLLSSLIGFGDYLPSQEQYTQDIMGRLRDTLASRAVQSRKSLGQNLASRGMTRSGALPAGLGQIEAGQTAALAGALPGISRDYYGLAGQEARTQLQALLGAGSVGSRMYMPRLQQYQDWTGLFGSLADLGLNIFGPGGFGMFGKGGGG